MQKIKFCCEQSSSADQSDIRVDRSWWGLHTSWMMLQRTVHCTVHMVYDVTRCTVHTSWMMLQKASLQRTVHTVCNVTVHSALCHSAQCTMWQCQSAQHTIAQDSTQYNTQDSVLCSVEDSAQYSTQCTVQHTVHSVHSQCTVPSVAQQWKLHFRSQNMPSSDCNMQWSCDQRNKQNLWTMSIIERLYNKKSHRTGLTERTYLTSETLHLTSSGKERVLVRTQSVVVPAE